ncbi:hypothetical protein Gotur_035693 [Gossypium turneri]
MHRSDKVLRQLGCRQPIPVEPEFEYIQMWEDRYDYIPSIEPIIVLELACLPEYMPWFRIHGKPYLLSPEERQRPNESTDTVTRPSSSTDDTHATAFSDDARLEPMARFSSISCYAEWTADVKASDVRRIARGTVGELFFLPIPTTIWVSNTVAVGDAKTSTFTILSRWLIVPTPTTRCPTERTRIPAGRTTTAARSWTKEVSSA